MTKIDPGHAADIGKAFDQYSALISKQPNHPTQTTKGSIWVDHADGTYSHWQVRWPMSMREVRREERLKEVQAGRRVQASFLYRFARTIGLIE